MTTHAERMPLNWEHTSSCLAAVDKNTCYCWPPPSADLSDGQCLKEEK